MKKINKLLITAASIACLTFTSCFNNVFYEIMQDVSSESATVSGSITSISRLAVSGKEFLVLAGNHPEETSQRGIRYKLADKNTHGQWKTYPIDKLPFKLHQYDYYDKQDHIGEQIIKIITDSENIYVTTVEYQNNTDEGTACPSKAHLWQAQFTADENNELTVTDDGWTDLCAETDYLPVYMYNGYAYSAFNVFSTNSPNPAHRFAYIRKGNSGAQDSAYSATTIYKLNGKAAPTEVADGTPFDISDGGVKNVCSAVYYPYGSSNADGVVFLNTTASGTNETATTAPSRLYYSVSSDLAYTDENSSTVHMASINAGEDIISLAVNKDSVILGKGNYSATSSSSTGGGVERVVITDGVPDSEIGNFSTNAQSQLLSSYFVTCLLSIDPSKNETDNAIYATIDFIGTGASSTVSYKNVGLWAYYSERGNWNRE